VRSGLTAAARPSKVSELAGEHLLHGLAADLEFACDLCLGDALVDERAHQVPPLNRESARDYRVLDCLRPDFLDTAEGLFVLGCCCHARSMTTRGCRVNQWLSRSPRALERTAGPARQLPANYPSIGSCSRLLAAPLLGVPQVSCESITCGQLTGA